MRLTEDVVAYIEAHQKETYDLLLELAQIPAPSNYEHRRAEFCKDYLTKHGAVGVYIDDALNVVYPVGCEGKNKLAVYAAHSDVVFPDTDTLPLRVSDGYIHCPGVGDDTANVVALLLAARYIAEHSLQSDEWGILLVINSGEEGLGNLKGCKKLFSDFGSRIREFITFDLNFDRLYNRAVGSRRFCVRVRTVGGHSLMDFGNPNAIACLCAVVNDLYSIRVPEQGRTTYNVGTICGGTSVNTIAQYAEMLYEFRSDERQSLTWMQTEFEKVIEKHRLNGLDITYEMIGDRPCSADVDPALLQELSDRGAAAAERWCGTTPNRLSGSTDCNIPLSLGIPAICIGCVIGDGAHTREEKVRIDSLLPGWKLCLDLVLHHF